MYEISKENRNNLVTYLDNSILPHNEVKILCQMLMKLKEIEQVVEKPKSEKEVN